MRLQYRSLTTKDLPTLETWLAGRHVKEWYQPRHMDAQAVAERYRPRIRGEVPTNCHIALLGSTPIAFLQSYRMVDWPDWAGQTGEWAGIGVDFFIGPNELLGKGLGRRVLANYLPVAFDACEAERVAWTAHDATNGRALACSQAAGFRLVRHFSEDGRAMALMQFADQEA